jgi:hypothetical protein
MQNSESKITIPAFWNNFQKLSTLMGGMFVERLKAYPKSHPERSEGSRRMQHFASISHHSPPRFFAPLRMTHMFWDRL